MREWWRSARALPQVLLVQPERLSFDSAYFVALVPLVALGLLFFRRSALLLFALCFLTGIVCLLTLQFARLTLGLPAWVGHKANHPLVSSLLVACFLSPQTPAWVGVSLVALLVFLDTLIWPQVVRMLVHPALVIFAVLFAIQRYFPTVFVNPFDLRPLEDPLILWYRLHVTVDPIKLYVGNVAGPMGVTSMAALLLGLSYLWYTRKINLGALLGFISGVAAIALARGDDLILQLGNGPSLFLAGYLAADRRRTLLPERFAFLLGAAGGGCTVMLRSYGQGTDATWQSLLVLSLVGTIALQLGTSLPFGSAKHRPTSRPLAWKTVSIRSSPMKAAPSSGVAAPRLAPEPVVAAAPVGTQPLRPSATPARGRPIDSGLAPDEMVKRMRVEAGRVSITSARAGTNPIVLVLALLLVNPLGLWLTWRGTFALWAKWAVSAASLVWYVGMALAGVLLLLPVRH